MNDKIINQITQIQNLEIAENRKKLLQGFVEKLILNLSTNRTVSINFICTHNSRRSHLAQVWAQVAASYFGYHGIRCYSGGTEQTMVFDQVIKTLSSQGFDILELTNGANPVYAIKFDENESPIIAFSKTYQHNFNPQSDFIAVMTCTEADNDCPIVNGSEQRFSIPYLDPKVSDGTPLQIKTYEERSMQIASEMFFVFENVKACQKRAIV